MWVQLVIMIVAMILSAAMRPKNQTPPPASLSDVSVPTIQQGTPVAVAFGDVWIDQPFVLWYGDLRSQAITAGGKK